MKWTYVIRNKVIASLALLSLCGLVLLSNHIDNRHTENVKSAISTLYEDRLVAEYYILQMTSGFHRIGDLLQLNHPAHEQKITVLLSGVKKIHTDYLKTKFTDEEQLKADQMSDLIADLEGVPLYDNTTRLKYIASGLLILDALSEIQLKESKQIMKQAEGLYLRGKSNSQYVFATIIIILLVLQAIVFASKTMMPALPSETHHLN
jgi:hypothetical protein